MIRLFFDGFDVQLLAEGGRFDFIDYKISERHSENIFLTVPLQSGGLSAYHKPDRKIEIFEEAYNDPVP
jgi:hypothetical protein